MLQTLTAMEAAATRLADVLGTLSSAADLAAGVPTETSLRVCMLSTALAVRFGLSTQQQRDVYYAGLLRHLGCTGLSHEAGSLSGGDDHASQRFMEVLDLSQHPEPAQRQMIAALRGVCQQALSLASDLGMSEGVVRVLGQLHERFDGRGIEGLRGDGLDSVARTLHVAMLTETLYRQGGWSRVTEELARRSGAQLDPEICALVVTNSSYFLPILDATSLWDAYLDSEPSAPAQISDEQLDAAALAFARYTDLKCPIMLGHSPAVASLVVQAASIDGLEAELVPGLRHAALLHDLGLASVPNGILEKPAPLTVVEWERLRLHAYFTDRILARLPAFAWVARVAGFHHERVDASGYPRGVSPAATERAARLLACADSYQALIENRYHRSALEPTAAANILRTQARDGSLCARSVNAVLAAAGHDDSTPRAQPVRSLPGGLTQREAEVLVHVARGYTSKEVATQLAISTRTVQHHLEHIYAKLGVSTRAAAALFAVRNELLG
jgi:HD-GYP domain-containing protein (c-di-GMP phosphodiesterase class II)/DNA-binding CsgD family transcriptional regulator